MPYPEDIWIRKTNGKFETVFDSKKKMIMQKLICLSREYNCISKFKAFSQLQKKRKFIWFKIMIFGCGGIVIYLSKYKNREGIKKK